LLLLGPQTPMLFMGEEFQCSRAFHYFIDHHSELASAVWQGRREFLSQFRTYASEAARAQIAEPAAESSFQGSKLDWSEAASNRHAVQLHQDLLRLRREDPVISAQDASRIDGATLSEHAFVLRWFSDEHGDRLLVINLQQELVLDPASEPLLAPPPDREWHLLWSSEEPHYQGSGAISPCDKERRWRIPANCASLLWDVTR
jgi:maltooligosyltrehalose trehalohydrolase